MSSEEGKPKGHPHRWDLHKIPEKTKAYLQPLPIEREGGYYWVKFPGKSWWEPASYDSGTRTWALIGSRDEWLEIQLAVIGPKMEPPLPF